MLKDYVFINFELIVFFFRLLGFFVFRMEIFYFLKCSKDGDIVLWFLMRFRDEFYLWNEGIVRNGYFQVLIFFIEYIDGMFWFKDLGENMIIIDRKEVLYLNSEFVFGGVFLSDSQVNIIMDGVVFLQLDRL